MDYIDAKIALMEQRKLQRATFQKDKKAMSRQIKARKKRAAGHR